MKRPDIESLLARASSLNRVSMGGNATLELIRYVQILERALLLRTSAMADVYEATRQMLTCIAEAERELFPEEQP